MVVSKKTPKFKKLFLQQSKLKSALHTDMEDYYRITVQKAQGKRVKYPIPMTTLIEREKEINAIRREIKKPPVKMVQALNKRLKALRE